MQLVAFSLTPAMLLSTGGQLVEGPFQLRHISQYLFKHVGHFQRRCVLPFYAQACLFYRNGFVINFRTRATARLATFT